MSECVRGRREIEADSDRGKGESETHVRDRGASNHDQVWYMYICIIMNVALRYSLTHSLYM